MTDNSNKPMLDIVLTYLEENKNWLKQISKESGVPFGTLKKIHYRTTKNPGTNHVQALYDHYISRSGNSSTG